MTSLVPIVRSLERRFLVLLRTPVQSLRETLPKGAEPVERSGSGFLVLDYRQRCPLEVGPWALGPGSIQLALGVPVRRQRAEGQEHKVGLWIARRWDDWKLRRHLPDRFFTPRTPRPAEFNYVEHELQIELEVRSEGVRQLYLRAEAQGHFGDSLFTSRADAERELGSWSRDIDAPTLPRPLSEEVPQPLIATQESCLQPLHSHALQSAAIPQAFGNAEVEFDCAFRVARRHMQPLALSPLRNWRELQRRRRFSAPPEGACSVAG